MQRRNETRNTKAGRFGLIPVAALMLAVAAAGARAEELDHSTRTDFAPGSFFQTVLGGTEDHPDIGIGSFWSTTVTFDDDTIGAWVYDTNEPGNAAEEDPDGQIRLYALFGESENGSWAYASNSDIVVSDRFSVEFLIYIDSIDSSGTADPFAVQPDGASCRLDLFRSDLGFRMDIFRDRMVSFYRVGETGVDYPVISNIDVATGVGQWYTIRFECDFTDPDLPVQVYRDGSYIGELSADSTNAVASAGVRALAFSRAETSGPAEFHVDRVTAGGLVSEHYGSGVYTSAVLELTAASFDTFTWTGVPASVYPWQSWVKHAGNPVLGPAALPENMLAAVDDPLQQPAEYDGRYWLCYSSGGPGQSIHLAYSTDPELLVWTDYESNPALAPAAGEDYLFSPHLFVEGSTYYLFYDVALSSDSRQRIAYATAPAPTGPWTRGQIILDRGAAGEWDDYRVAECFVMKEGDTYFLYYMGNRDCIGCTEQIGLATTSSALFPLGPETDGRWTKQGAVLSPGPDPSQWDGVLVSNPSIVRSGDLYLMRYSGSTDNIDWQAGTAWATDPYGPWNRPDAPDIGYGPPGAWDSQRILRGALHYHGGKWYSTYSGNDGAGGWEAYSGGIATADPVIPADSILFETRTSNDGTVWEDWQPVANGDTVKSWPRRFFQYRASFTLGSNGESPLLTGVYMPYIFGTATGDGEMPPALGMDLPYPNPFNPRTTVGFTVDVRRNVRIAVYDVRGGRVAVIADRVFDAGRHEVAWDGTNGEGRTVSSGVYFMRMEAGEFIETKRIVLIR